MNNTYNPDVNFTALCPESLMAVEKTIPKPWQKAKKKDTRKLGCIGSGCLKDGKKHPANEMWTYTVNKYNQERRCVKRFCESCAIKYNGKYNLVAPVE